MYRDDPHPRNWLEEMDSGGGGGGVNKGENISNEEEGESGIIMIRKDCSCGGGCSGGGGGVGRRTRRTRSGSWSRICRTQDLSRILAVLWLILSVGSSVAVMAYQNDLSSIASSSSSSSSGSGGSSSSSREMDGGVLANVLESSKTSSSSSSSLLGCLWSRTGGNSNNNGNINTNRKLGAVSASGSNSNSGGNGQQNTNGMYAPGNNPFQEEQRRLQHHQSFSSSSLSSSSSPLGSQSSSLSSSSSSGLREEGLLTLSCNVRTLNTDFANYTGNRGSFTREQAEEARVARVHCSDKIYFQSYLLPNQSLFQLRNLNQLEIFSCKIRKVPKGVFSSWRYLKKLGIHTNNFQWAPSVGLELESGAFQGLEALTELDLSQSNLWTLFPEPNVLCPMRNLGKLNVSWNRLTDIDEFGLEGAGDGGNKEGGGSSSFYCTLNIQTLDLSHNSLRRVGRLNRLRRVVELRMQNNLIEELEDTVFLQMTQLQILNLSSNRLVALPPSVFSSSGSGGGGGPTNLREILLSNNSISALSPQLFQGLDQLLLLDLSRNFLQDVSSDKVFSGLVRLVVLKLSFNQIRTIPSNLFRDLISLQVLYLDNNQIEVIEPEAFSNLRNLNTINLSRNRISSIDSRLFSNLFVLKQLYLDFNEISELDDTSLKNRTSLEDLGLSKNKLTQIPYAIRGLGQLKSLDLGENRINSVSNESFSGLTQMYGLRLVDNRISELPAGFCESMKNLRVLNVAQNRISRVSSSAFTSCPEVRALRLDANLLEEIPLSLADQLPSLLWLNVSDNQRLKWADYRLLPTTLEWLDVSHNSIESLQKPDSLPLLQVTSRRGNYNRNATTLFNLRVLDASYNKLTSLDHTNIPPLLDTLRLNHNHLSQIAPDTFNRGANRLRRVELIGNQIESLPLSSIRFSQIPKGRNVEMYLGDNPFLCECSMEWLTRVNQLQILRQYPRIVDLNNIVCRPTFPRSYSNVQKISSSNSTASLFAPSQVIPLLEAQPNQFLCPYTSHCFALCHCCEFEFCDCQNFCPDNCSCYHDQAWTSNIVDCSNLQYSQVPPRIPMDATEIYLDGNLFGNELSSHIFIGKKNLRSLFLNNSQIETIKNKTFNGLKSLEILHLENNLLKEIQDHNFQDLTGLKQLYLQNNLIQYISPTSFEKMTFLSVLRLDGNLLVDFNVWELTKTNSYLHSLMLSGNPWTCDCSFVNPFRRWVASLKNNIVVDFALAKCQQEGEAYLEGNNSSSSHNSSETTILTPGGSAIPGTSTSTSTTTTTTLISQPTLLISSMCNPFSAGTNENLSFMNNHISSMGGVAAQSNAKNTNSNNNNLNSHLSGPYQHAHLDNSAGYYGHEFPHNENIIGATSAAAAASAGERGGGHQHRESKTSGVASEEDNLTGSSTFLICLVTFIAIILVVSSALLVAITVRRRKRGLAGESGSESSSSGPWWLCCFSKCGINEGSALALAKCLSSPSSSSPNEGGDGRESSNNSSFPGESGPYFHSDTEKLFDAYFIYSHKDEDFVTEKLTGELEQRLGLGGGGGGGQQYNHHPHHYHYSGTTTTMTSSRKLRLCLHFRDLCLAPDNPWSSEMILSACGASKRVVLVISSNFLSSEWNNNNFRCSVISAMKEHWRKLVFIKLPPVTDTSYIDQMLQLPKQLSSNNNNNNNNSAKHQGGQNNSPFPVKLDWTDKNFWPKFRLLLPHHQEGGAAAVLTLNSSHHPPTTIPGGNNNRGDVIISQQLPYTAHLNLNEMNYLNAAAAAAMNGGTTTTTTFIPMLAPHPYHPCDPLMSQAFPLSHLSAVHPAPSQITPQQFGYQNNNGNLGNNGQQTIFFSNQIPPPHPPQQHQQQPLLFPPTSTVRGSMRRQHQHQNVYNNNQTHPCSQPPPPPPQHIHSLSQLSNMSSSKSPLEANYSSSAVSSDFENHVYSTLDLDSPCSDDVGTQYGGAMMMNGAQMNRHHQHSDSTSGISDGSGSGTSGSGGGGAPPMYFV